MATIPNEQVGAILSSARRQYAPALKDLGASRPTGPRIPHPIDNTGLHEPGVPVPCGACGQLVPANAGVQAFVPSQDGRGSHLCVLHVACFRGD